MVDKYYGPDKYKGIVKNLPKRLRSKYKGKYIGPERDKGKRNYKRNPRRPKFVIRTSKPGVPTKSQDVVNSWDQSDEILNAYLAMAGIELFQYMNTYTVDGMHSDVSIINVLSSRRDHETPNKIIEKEDSVVLRMWIDVVWVGPPANKVLDTAKSYLRIEVVDQPYDECILTLYPIMEQAIFARTIN